MWLNGILSSTQGRSSGDYTYTRRGGTDDSSSLRVPQAADRSRSCGNAAETRRRSQNPEWRPEPDPHDEAAPGTAGVPQRHQPHSRALVYQGGWGISEDRRSHAGIGTGKLTAY